MPKIHYKSRYTDKDVTAIQYICELLCERKASFDKKELPQRFWVLPEWASFYKKNLRKVSSLIRKYGEEAVIKAVKSPEMKGRYSIFTEFCKERIVQEKIIIDRRSDQATKINRETTKSVGRPSQKIKGIIGLLEEEE